MDAIQRLGGTFLDAELLSVEWADFSQRIPGTMNHHNTMVPAPIPTSSPVAANAPANKPAMMPTPTNNAASIPDSAHAAVSSTTNTPISIPTASIQQHQLHGRLTLGGIGGVTEPILKVRVTGNMTCNESSTQSQLQTRENLLSLGSKTRSPLFLVETLFFRQRASCLCLPLCTRNQEVFIKT
jgi:hypothetical protein